MKYDQCVMLTQELELLGEQTAEHCSRSCMQEGSHSVSRTRAYCKTKVEDLTNRLHDVDEQE